LVFLLALELGMPYRSKMALLFFSKIPEKGTRASVMKASFEVRRRRTKKNGLVLLLPVRNCPEVFRGPVIVKRYVKFVTNDSQS